MERLKLFDSSIINSEVLELKQVQEHLLESEELLPPADPCNRQQLLLMTTMRKLKRYSTQP